MFHILVEKSYLGNNRLKLILDGINVIARKKRLGVKVYDKKDDLPADVRVIILIGASLRWAADMIDEMNMRGIHPLLFGFQDINNILRYSCITFSYTKSTYLLTKSLLLKDSGKTAFIGYNEDSLPDRLKLAGVDYAAREFGAEKVVIQNEGSTVACIERFMKERDGVRNIICGNDSFAILLRSCYPHLLEGCQLCSCSGMRISEFLVDPYPTLRIDYFHAGCKIAELYLFLTRSEDITPTTVVMDMKIACGNLENVEAAAIKDVIPSTHIVDYYGDQPIRDVEHFDNMLLNLDEKDMSILRDMIGGYSYEQIAEKYDIALNTVKYRIKAMLKNADCHSREDILKRISEYRLDFSRRF